MRAAKVDINQPAIVAALRDAGASVEPLHRVGAGCPDLLVGIRGQNYLLEVKNGKGKLNDIQQKWHPAWRGQVAVVTTPEEALTVIGLTNYRALRNQIVGEE